MGQFPILFISSPSPKPALTRGLRRIASTHHPSSPAAILAIVAFGASAPPPVSTFPTPTPINPSPAGALLVTAARLADPSSRLSPGPLSKQSTLPVPIAGDFALQSFQGLQSRDPPSSGYCKLATRVPSTGRLIMQRRRIAFPHCTSSWASLCEPISNRDACLRNSITLGGGGGAGARRGPPWDPRREFKNSDAPRRSFYTYLRSHGVLPEGPSSSTSARFLIALQFLAR